MYEIYELVFAAGAALLLGLGLGALFSRRFSLDGRKQRELERNVERLMEQQKGYQSQVVSHFTDTAKLLNNLAESYRDVHNHLASGASVLCDEEDRPVIRPILEATTAKAFEPDSVVSSVSQPLDYAPKTSTDAAGVLNEDFGLEKQARPAQSDSLDFVPTPAPEEPIAESDPETGPERSKQA